MSLARDAAAGVRWNTVSMVGSTALQTVTLLVLARLLEPDDFGLLAMVVLVTGLAALVSTMGLSEALIQRSEATEEQLHSLYWANLALGAGAFGLVWLAAPLVADLFEEQALINLVRVAGLILIINSLSAQFRALLQKALEFRPLAVVNVSAVAVGSFVAIALAVGNAGVWALVWGQVANAVAATVLLVVIGAGRGWLPRLTFSYRSITEYLSFGAYLFGSNVANYLVSRSDQLIIGTVLGSRPLGFYSMAFNLVVRPTTMINPVITQVAFPVLARLQDDTERMKRGYLRMLRILSSVNAPVLLGFAAVAPVVIPWILGEKWTPIVTLVQILALYALIRSIGNAGGSLAIAAGRANWVFYWNLALLAFIPAVVWVGAESGGLEGVAYSLAALQVALLFVWYRLFVVTLVGRCFGRYIQSFAVPAAFAVLMAVVVRLASELTDSIHPAAATAGLVTLGAAAYMALYWTYQREDLVDTTRLLFGRQSE